MIAVKAENIKNQHVATLVICYPFVSHHFSEKKNQWAIMSPFINMTKMQWSLFSRFWILNKNVWRLKEYLLDIPRGVCKQSFYRVGILQYKNVHSA